MPEKMLTAFLQHTFPVSGVEINVLVPPLTALIIAFFTSTGGVSGAFLLLPFQMSVLNYTAPSVSGTNHVYNIFAIPSGVYQYIKEGRMAWPLTWVMISGTIPGVLAGYYLRVMYLPDPRTFKLFAGCLLMYIGIRLLYGLLDKSKSGAIKTLEEKFRLRTAEIKKERSALLAAGIPSDAVVKTLSCSTFRIEYEFWGERFSFNPVLMFLVSLAVGAIGGAYGIGGGAIIAPLCVAVFHLPVYSIAGAALMGTFMTSLTGALFYTLLPSMGSAPVRPDWSLGMLFGIGGFVGMYLGARFQKYMPQQVIRVMLGAVLVYIASRYIIQFF